MKKLAGNIIIFHMCTKITIIWCTVLEIRSETDKSFCHFGPFFSLLPPPLMILNIKILKKMRKMPGDIILLYIHMYHKWRSYDNGSWNIRCERQKFSTFWATFSLTAQKIKIWKKWKKRLEISSFYNSVPRIMIMCYTVPEIWCEADVIIFHFGPFFAFLHP